MTGTRLKGWMFFVSGFLLAICCFLPITKLTAHFADGSKEDTYVKLMPSLSGFIVLMLGLACCIIALVGFKDKACLIGTLAAISAGSIVAYTAYTSSKPSYATLATDAILSGILGSNGNSVVERTSSTGAGLYLFVLAIILVLITGFIYTFASDDY